MLIVETKPLSCNPKTFHVPDLAVTIDEACTEDMESVVPALDIINSIKDI
jgi:hypothetical protein